MATMFIHLARLVTHCSRLYGGQSDLSQNDPSSLAKSSDINEGRLKFEFLYV